MTVQTATPHLVLRAYRGPEDHPAMAAVAAAVRTFNGDAEIGTRADMDNRYGHLDQAALPRDCAIVEVQGRVVAYGRASWQPLADGGAGVDAIVNILPETRSRGIEKLLLDHAVRRAGELIAERGGGPSTRLVVYITGRDPDQRAELEVRGFQRVRRAAQLIRPDLEAIPALPIPAPFEVRLIDPGDRAMHRRIFDADARAFAHSYGQQAPSEAEYDEFINMPTFDPTLWRVAFHGHEIAGQVLSYRGEPRPDETWIGWTEAISVQAEYRRRGLARALLAASLGAVRDAGASSAGLGVDTQNPNRALTLYEDLGFRIVSESFEYELRPVPSVARSMDGSVVQ